MALFLREYAGRYMGIQCDINGSEMALAKAEERSMPRSNHAIALVEYQKKRGSDHTVSISYYPKNAERWRLERPAYRFTRLATDKEIMEHNTRECLECGESFISIEPSDTCGRCEAKLHTDPVGRGE